MRIAIDARKLRDFGIGTYIRNILSELSLLDQKTEYVVICKPSDVETGHDLGPNFHIALITRHSPDERARAILVRSFAETPVPIPRGVFVTEARTSWRNSSWKR